MKTSGQNYCKVSIITYLICVIQVNGASLTITQYPQYPTVSTTAWLTCHIPSFTGAAEWHRNGVRLEVLCSPRSCIPPSIPGYQFSADATTMNVTILSLNIALDETTWTCTHNSGTDIGYINLKAYNPVGSVQVKNGTNLTLIESQSAVLVCETDSCRPSAAIYWMKNGINITDSYTSGLINERRVSIGTLNYTGQRGDNGTLLTCGAYNGLGSVKTSGNLTINIYYPPSIEGFTSPYKVIENQALNVTCVVTSNPPADRICWSPRGEGSVPSILYFMSVSRNNSGTYSCTAHNTMIPTVGTEQTGISTSEIQVDVLYGARISNLSVHGSNTINENSSAIFNCHVDSNPPPTITWMKEDSSTVLKTESEVVQSNYTIKSAECLDMGNYTCSADNGIWTTAKERLELFVRCHPRTDFRLNLTTKIYKKRHEAAILRYTVIAYPPPTFTWTFLGNGSESISLPVSASQHDNGQQSELRITNLDITDFGVYSIIANNSLVPSAMVVFEIIQADVPEVPSYVMAIEITQTSVEVHWMAGYNGGPQQTFHIVASAGNSIHSNFTDDPGFGQTGMAVLNGLLPGTKYSIYVVAINSIGPSNITQAIDVTTLEGMTVIDYKFPLPAILGGIGAGVAVILVVVVAVFLWRRYQHHNQYTDEKIYENAPHVGTSSKKENEYEGLSGSSWENAYAILGASNASMVDKESLLYVNLRLDPLTNENFHPLNNRTEVVQRN